MTAWFIPSLLAPYGRPNAARCLQHVGQPQTSQAPEVSLRPASSSLAAVALVHDITIHQYERKFTSDQQAYFVKAITERLVICIGGVHLQHLKTRSPMEYTEDAYFPAFGSPRLRQPQSTHFVFGFRQ